MIKFLIIPLFTVIFHGEVSVPVLSADRNDVSTIHLTEIGKFGLLRSARKSVPEHYHTGIDIKRPGNNYKSEPIFPVSRGIVISKRTDGPYANLIIEHEIKGEKVWTVYEHIAGIKVAVGEAVDQTTHIARFMNRDELNRYGWQFDHFHLEIIKVKPQKVNPSKETPERYYDSYTLVCYTIADLHKYYYDPISFFKSNL
jgi:hypothetical protein